MTVGDLITMLRAYPNDDEIEIQVFETNSGELIDSTSAIGIVEEDIFDPTFSIDIEAEKFRNVHTPAVVFLANANTVWV